MGQIIELLKENNYEEALKMLSSDLRVGFTVEKAITGAVIEEHYKQYNDEFDLISHGLLLDSTNCILYYLLGNYYKRFNKNKALLSYKNARYHYGIHGIQDEDLATVVFHKKPSEAIDEAIEDVSDCTDVRDVSIVIISYNTYEYTRWCIESIRATCDQDIEIIVVDNHSVDGSLEWLRNQRDILLIENQENVGFPKGCNQGIMRAKEENDIFLLNSDTCMLANSLFYLRLGLYDNDKNGTAGSITNYAGNYQSVDFKLLSIGDKVEHFAKYNRPVKNPFEMKTYLIGFALLIRRTALEKVGVLDDRFTPGNYEDNDLGIRMLEAGYRNVLVHNSFIVHYGSKSFLKNEVEYVRISERNKQKFCDKWKFNPSYFNWIRTDLIDLFDAKSDAEIKVLEIGCGFGDTLSRIKYLFHNAEIHGIEIVERIAHMAHEKANVIYGDITTMTLPYEKKYFDYIVIGDVLEHLVEPGKVLEMLSEYLVDEGKIISSIPNLMNAKVIYDLLHGDFDYQDAGILDRTHLRFFTYKGAMELFTQNGYDLETFFLKVVPSDCTNEYASFFDQLLKIDGVCERCFFDAYQFLIRAKVKRK